jgi:hypothetical protein
MVAFIACEGDGNEAAEPVHGKAGASGFLREHKAGAKTADVRRKCRISSAAF